MDVSWPVGVRITGSRCGPGGQREARDAAPNLRIRNVCRPEICPSVNDVQERLISVLNHSAERLRSAGLTGDLAMRLEGLAMQVRQPCTVAVVGPVKVGKSTFVNALLGEDHAKVGTTETTATINYFSYADPKDYEPERPVRCH